LSTTPGDFMRASDSGVHALVPMLHVASVQQSIGFYGLLGLSCARRMDGPDGRPFWARLEGAGSAGACLMLASASGPIDAGVQAVLLYLYSSDVRALRERLLHAGVPDGGAYGGQPLATSTAGGRTDHRRVFGVAHPHYMPAGELRVHDPDGYVLLVGQEP
jgi:hypothetical protein